MSWLFLVIAGTFEMFGVGTIKLYTEKKNLPSLLLLLAAFGGSFVFLYLAMKQLPMGIAYAVWTGIGTAGGAILGMLVYGESKDKRRIFFIFLIIASVIGLKIMAS